MQTNHYKNLLTQAEKLYRHNRQGSYKTKLRYFEAYKRFLKFLSDEYRLEKIVNISGKHLSRYVEYMQDKELSASSIKTDLSAIRFWHDKISNTKYVLPSNDTFDLEQREIGKLDRTWSNREFNLMLGECMKAGRDDYEACIVIARYAGLRLHETMRIDTAIARAALKNGYFTIKGKGGRVRDVPINATIRIELEKFLKVTPVGYKLFVPEGKKTHIAMKGLENFIASHRKQVKDPDSARPLYFHGLRHLFSCDAYKRFVAEGYSDYEARKQLAQLLGHSRIDVVKIYLAGLKEEDIDV